jgi:prepilin peptidase CpaA
MIFALSMVIAAASDVLSMTIANGISILLVVAFAVSAPLTEIGLTIYGWHFAVGASALAVTFLLFALNAMGGGDSKLIAATAVWMGPGLPLAQYLVWGAMLGGLLTLALLALRYSPLAAPASNTRLFRHLADRKAGIPYGIALGAAGLLAFPSSPLGIWALAQM